MTEAERIRKEFNINEEDQYTDDELLDFEIGLNDHINKYGSIDIDDLYDSFIGG